MNEMNRHAIFEKASRALKVLAHPTRLQIIELLYDKPGLCVSDIQTNLSDDIEQSMLSHHLNKMKDVALVRSEKAGKNNNYFISNLKIINIVDCITQNYGQ